MVHAQARSANELVVAQRPLVGHRDLAYEQLNRFAGTALADTV